MVGHVGAERRSSSRRPPGSRNGPVRADDGSLRWDVVALSSRDPRPGCEPLPGIVDAIGVDAWAVDYGLLAPRASCSGTPYHYRDERTAPSATRSRRRCQRRSSTATRAAAPAVQHALPARRRPAVALDEASTLLLIPDLFRFWLTGESAAEGTNASTTQLLRRACPWLDRLTWSTRVDVPLRLLPADPRAGRPSSARCCRGRGRDRAGRGHPGGGGRVRTTPHPPWSACRSRMLAARRTSPAAPGRSSASSSITRCSPMPPRSELHERGRRRRDHALPAQRDGSVAAERVHPTWGLGTPEDLRVLLAEAEDAPAFVAGVRRRRPACSWLRVTCRPHRPLVLGARRRRAADASRDGAQPAREPRAGVPRRGAAGSRPQRSARGRRAHRRRRCPQRAALPADCRPCGVPVLAGPVEATALGNVLVQARALGADLADLPAMRSLLRSTQDLVRYDPTPGTQDRWAEASRTIGAAPSAAAGR